MSRLSDPLVRHKISISRNVAAPLDLAGKARFSLFQRQWFASLCPTVLLSGCSWNGGFLDAAGPIAANQKADFLWIVALMMIVVLPMFIALPIVLWRYSLKRGRGVYQPDWDFNWALEMVLWGVPVVLLVILGTSLWRVTHRLDPYARIAADQPALAVDVVMMDWKFLFLYPAESIATVNRLVIPAGRPVAFRLTSADVMQSFIIPRLGGQIYTMPGMVTQLGLLADRPGQYEGENAQYNGKGFAQQKFITDVMTLADYQAWVAQTQASGTTLDAATFLRLEKPSGLSDPVSFRRIDGDLFAAIVGRFGMNMQSGVAP